MLWSAYCSQSGLFVCTAYKLHAVTNWRSKRLISTMERRGWTGKHELGTTSGTGTHQHTPTYVESVTEYVHRVHTPTYVESVTEYVHRVHTPTYVESVTEYVHRVHTPTYVESVTEYVHRVHSPTHSPPMLALAMTM